MGADLIAYIAVGPLTLTKKQKADAVKKYVKCWEKELKTNQIECSECGEKFTPEPDDDNTIMCPGCNRKITWHKDLAEAKKWATEMVNEWPPDFRDCGSRQLPGSKTKWIFVAGDMSWGDRPDGLGYRYLDDLFMSGLNVFMGIE